MRVGPKDHQNPTELAMYNGSYQYLIVGKDSAGKLAGVMFESVET